MSDLEYYRERLAQESKAARTADCPEAEMIHRALATAYARKARGEMDGGVSYAVPDREKVVSLSDISSR